MASYDIFTPKEVSLKMISYFTKKIKLLLEPSVGTGNLLVAAEGMYSRADVYDINLEYLESIPDTDTVHKHNCNFLNENIEERYDGILMNPPYHKFQDISSEMRTTIRKLSPVLSSGNIDLYVAFLVKSIQLLSDDGMLVAIVPSTWMYNASCKKFRNMLNSHRLIHAIHDYGSNKVFPKINVYCCILVITKSSKEGYFLNDTFKPYSVDSAKDHRTLDSICEIQNGIATLCDNVFIHDKKLFNEPCWIEILKVSKNAFRYIIFPYTSEGVILKEEALKLNNPRTYEYLLENKKKLSERDRGNKTYDAWYAFGRKQGLKIPDVKNSLYVSTLCNPEIPMNKYPSGIFYSGIRITPKVGYSCENIEKCISDNKNVMIEMCSKRSGGWINVTASVLKQVQVSL